MEDKSAGKEVEKRNKKSREKESDADRGAFPAGGKGRKMREGEREGGRGGEEGLCGALL